MSDFILILPDDPATAQAQLIERLTQIAEDQCHLTRLLDELSIPTHQHGQRLTFHQRVAVLSGLYAATLETLGERL